MRSRKALIVSLALVLGLSMVVLVAPAGDTDAATADDVTANPTGPWDVSAEKDGSVTASLVSNGSGGYVLTIEGSGPMEDYAKWESATTTDRPYFRTAAPWWLTSVLSTEDIDLSDSDAYDGTYLTGITGIIVGDGVTRIGSSAFSFMKDVTSITIADTVTSMGDRALMYNYSLTSITIPDSVVIDEVGYSNEDRDGELLLGHCHRLQDVALGSGITVIPCRAFENTLLGPDEIDMDQSIITEIGVQAFYDDTGYFQESTVDLSGFTSLKVLHHASFRGWEVVDLILPSSLECYGNDDGEGANTIFNDVRTVNWDDLVNLRYIGNQAFAGTSLESADMSATALEEIAWKAFYGCSNLTTVVLPETIETIDNRNGGPFQGLAQFSTITVPGDKAHLLNGCYDPELTTIVSYGYDEPTEDTAITLTHEGVPTYFASFASAADAAVAGDSITLTESATGYTFQEGEVAAVVDDVDVDQTIVNAAGAMFDEDGATAYCDTFQTALGMCQEGSVVTLMKDVEVSANINISKDVTIDLGEKRITSTAWAAPLRVLGGYTVTITSGTVANTGGGICVDTENDSVTTLSDLTIESDNTDSNVIRARNSTIVLTDVTMEGLSLYANSPTSGSEPFEPRLFVGEGNKTSDPIVNQFSDCHWHVYFADVGSMEPKGNATYYDLNCGIDQIDVTDLSRDGCVLQWMTSETEGEVAATIAKETRYYANWIDVSDLTAEYEFGGTAENPSIPDTDGITYSGWASDNPSIVSFDNDTLSINGIGNATVSATAETNAGSFDVTFDVTVSAPSGLTQAELSGITLTSEAVTYNAKGILPLEGALTAYVANVAVDVGTFTVSIIGTNLSSTVSNVASGTSISEITGLTLPTTPGGYDVTVSATGDEYYAYGSWHFTIERATLTVTADDVTIDVWDEPELTYNVEGWLEADDYYTFKVSVTEDLEPGNEYPIEVSDGDLDDAEDCYVIEYVPGTLTVNPLPVEFDTDFVAVTVEQGYASASGKVTITNTGEEDVALAVSYSGIRLNVQDTVTVPAGGSTDFMLVFESGITAGLHNGTVSFSIEDYQVCEIDVALEVMTGTVSVGSDEDTATIVLDLDYGTFADSVKVRWDEGYLERDTDYTLSEGSIRITLTEAFIEKVRQSGLAGEEMHLEVSTTAGKSFYTFTVEPASGQHVNPPTVDDEDLPFPPIAGQSDDDDSVTIVACAAAAVVAALMAVFLILTYRKD